MAAVGIGIAGSTLYNSKKASDLSLSNTLRKVSAIIFLVVTALLALHTVFVIREERAALRESPPSPLDLYRSAAHHSIFHIGRGALPRGTIGATHGTYILCLIVVLLLIREIFLTATLSSISHQKEGEWYPLAALPELLVVFLFATPGLVPQKSDLVAQARGLEKDPESTELA